LIHPDDIQEWRAHYAEEHDGSVEMKKTAGDMAKEVDFRILHADGEVRWISHTSYPIYDENGCNLGRRISNRDITDRKNIEDALRRSEETLSRAQSVAEIGSWQLDIPTNRIECSEETCRLFGISSQQGFDAKRMMATIHPEDLAMFLSAWKAALAGALFDCTHRIVVRGDVLWVRSRAEIQWNGEGCPLSGIGTVQNVTDRKDFEDQLVTLAQKLQTILDTLTVGVTFFKNRQVQWVNAAHDRMFGYTHGEVVGLDSSIFYVNEEDYKRVGEAYAQLAKGASYSMEVEMKTKDRHHFWCSLSGRAVQPDNPDAGSIWVFMDIAERKIVEDKLHVFAETQSVLLQEVNHRVKNNLVAIISMLHKEEDLAQDKGMTEYHARIKELVWRISSLLTVHRLLSSSEWKPLPLTRLCESIIQGTLKGLTAIRSIHLDISPSAIEVDSDQAHALAMVLNELSTNVIKYAMGERDALHITITIQQVGNEIELWFQDDGPGFPEALLQEEVSRRSSSIGMSLLQGLVARNLRGSLCLMNNNGALARITFPIMNHEEAIEMKENQS
jgi:PAS domain S-box-containing protein